MGNSVRIKVKRAYLVNLRQSHRISGKEIADTIGMTASKYYRIERGEYDFSSDREQELYLSRLAELYVLPIEWLYDREKEYIDKKIEFIQSDKYSGRVYTLYREQVKRLRKENPTLSKTECAEKLKIAYNTVNKYWDEGESDNEKADNS